MKTIFLSLLVSAFLFHSAYSQSVYRHGNRNHFKFRLALNGYNGNIAIDNNLLFYPKNNYKFKLDTGFHYINTGATVGGFDSTENTSYISFHVNNKKEIDLLINKNSAEISADKKKITLKTIDVTIKSSNKSMPYFISIYHLNERADTGTVKIKMIKSQTYNYDNGAAIGLIDSTSFNASYAYFSVNKNGKITSYNKNAAFVNKQNELEFIWKENKNFNPLKEFNIPESIKNIYYMKSQSPLQNVYGANTISYINSLVAMVWWLDDTGNQQVKYFIPH